METRDISSNPITSTAGGLDTAVYFVDEVEALQAEISRLEIAYKNASEQRSHYVKKCLELSCVVMEFSSAATFGHGIYSKELNNLHKDIINQLKRNIYLEVKK